MKNLLLLVFTTLSFIGIAQTPDFTGKWMNVSKTDEGFILDKDGFASNIRNNKITDGSGFEADGETWQLQYKIDYSKKPYAIDFTTVNKATKKEGSVLYGLLNMLEDGTIEITLSRIQRPETIDSTSKNYVRLKRE